MKARTYTVKVGRSVDIAVTFDDFLTYEQETTTAIKDMERATKYLKKKLKLAARVNKQNLDCLKGKA